MAEQPGKRSFVAPWFGGGSKPRRWRAGFRCILAPAGVGGGCKPRSTGAYGGNSLLAFWCGGAYWHYVPKRFALAEAGEGLPSARKRPFIDDDEIGEFLRLWVIWNDIEGP